MGEGRSDGGLDRLDDVDYPAYTMGRAAQVLGVQQAFLRSLDAAGVLTPQRSEGGHRRYSRRQLRLAERIREILDQGHSLAAARRIVELEDQLEDTRALLRDPRATFAGRDDRHQQQHRQTKTDTREG